MTIRAGHVTRRLGMSRSARSHALHNCKRRPPFLLSEGFSIRSQIASLIALSRYCSSLSRITIFSVLNACPVSLRWYTASCVPQWSRAYGVGWPGIWEIGKSHRCKFLSSSLYRTLFRIRSWIVYPSLLQRGTKLGSVYTPQRHWTRLQHWGCCDVIRLMKFSDAGCNVTSLQSNFRFRFNSLQYLNWMLML